MESVLNSLPSRQQASIAFATSKYVVLKLHYIKVLTLNLTPPPSMSSSSNSTKFTH